MSSGSAAVHTATDRLSERFMRLRKCSLLTVLNMCFVGAGSQRFGAAVWSGDTSSNWENFNQQFRAGLNFVMSGIPYWTTDIGRHSATWPRSPLQLISPVMQLTCPLHLAGVGGYNGGNVSSPGFRQLVVRWFQWGCVV